MVFIWRIQGLVLSKYLESFHRATLLSPVQPTSKTKPPPAFASGGFFVWWPGTESNHRHADFQSAALPTELPGLGKSKIIAPPERGIGGRSSGRWPLAAREVHAQLLELAVEVRALQAGLVGHTGHGALLFDQVVFKIGFFKAIAHLAQGAF
jgi:hypothetical protein